MPFTKCPVLPPATEGDASMVYPFSEEEYRKGVAILKNNKAAGRDDVLLEQLKNIGPKAHRRLLTMLNKCFRKNKITTIMKTVPEYCHTDAWERLQFKRGWTQKTQLTCNNVLSCHITAPWMTF